jgi:hypothetical protein
MCGGVADGTRTHDNQNHNLGLYQLSYSHRSEDFDCSLFYLAVMKLTQFFAGS